MKNDTFQLTPIFDHHCDDCLFLGAKQVESHYYDFYFCSSTRSNVARYGSSEGDYLSLPAFLTTVFKNMEPYKTCLELAELKNQSFA